MKVANRNGLAMLVIAATALLLGSGTAPAQDAANDGWVDLLKSRTFDNFTFHLTREGKDNEGTFKFEDGILVCNGRPSGYMITKKTYGKFTLTVDLAFVQDAKKKRTNGNSGILIHVAEKNALGVWPRSIEIQGMHRQSGLILPIPRNLKCKKTYNKAVFEKHVKPFGEWNSYEIDVNGGDLTIKLNGQVVSTVSDCELTSGPIAFQSEGAGTRWRNIRIREKK